LKSPASGSSVCCVFALILCFGTTVINGQPFKLTRTIPLPGVEGRIDHFAFDPVDHRLFICALGNNTVEVVGFGKGERIHSITGLGSPQGAVYVPELDRLFVANDEGGICKTFDGKSFQQVAELSLKDDADNVRYDDVAKRIYVGFGNGGIAIVDASTGKQTTSIKLSAHPEAFELEKNGKLIFVNVPNARHVAVVDRDKRRVVATWKTDLVLANFPMALDETNHRLFVGCRLPSKLVVLNTDTGNVAAKIDISSDADDLFYDAKRRCIYAVCGEGKIDIIDQTDADTYKILAKIDTAGGARTGFFIPEQDELLVAVPHRGSQSAEIRVYHIE
jgi:DNA-binding beta-propeller fold protein YncE